MELRGTIAYGFAAFNGVKWHDSQVDNYNSIQAQIDSFTLGKMPVPESLLDDSHRAFCLYSRLV